MNNLVVSLSLLLRPYNEVCPAGWKPGDKTMKPDPEGSKAGTMAG